MVLCYENMKQAVITVLTGFDVFSFAVLAHIQIIGYAQMNNQGSLSTYFLSILVFRFHIEKDSINRWKFCK